MKNKQLLLEYINETAHKLTGQDLVGIKIADEVYNNLYPNMKYPLKIDVDLSEFNLYSKTAIIVIHADSNLRDVYGQIVDFNPLKIELHISKFWDLIPQSQIKHNIKKTVVHEMMHGKVFDNKYL